MMTCRRCGAALATDRATYCPRGSACARSRNIEYCRARYWSHLATERARLRAWAAAHPGKARKWAREHPEAHRRSVRLAGIKHRALHRDAYLAGRRAWYANNRDRERARSLAYYHATTAALPAS